MTRIILSASQGILETLYRALREPIGLKIQTDAPIKRVRQWFYVEMRKRSPEFDSLILVNMTNELWVVKSDAQDPRRTDPSHDLPYQGEL